MTDLIWVISSSILILAVFLIRAVFGKKMSAGLRCALWGLVVLRLLIPGTLFTSPVSVGAAAEQTRVVRDIETLRGTESIGYMPSGSVIYVPIGPNNAVKPSSAPSVIGTVIEREATPERYEQMQRTIRAIDVLNVVWYTGMALMGAYILYVNIRFYLRLRDRRRLLSADSPCRVYSVEGLESSCLFLGSVYVSAEQAEDPDRLNCVLAHELAHRRHLDGVWTVLRSAALVLHWYNPLVWAAAFAARQDSELFADAGAIKELGENRRESYGATLIELSARPSVRASIACTATTMANNKKALKERVTNVAKKRRMSAVLIAAVLVVAAVAAAFTFAGAGRKAPELLPADNTPADSTPVPVTNAPATNSPVTPDPTPQITETPLRTPSETWLLENAWPYAAGMNSVHGLDLRREDASFRIRETECTVSFESAEDNVGLAVGFYRGDDEWYVGYSHVYNIDGTCGDADQISAVECGEMTITDEDFARAGYTPDGTDSDLIQAARIYAESYAALFTSCPEDNGCSCIEAKAADIRFFAIPLTENVPTEIWALMYFRPRNVANFVSLFMDIMCEAAGNDTPYPGWVMYDLPLGIYVMRGDAGITCSAGYSSGSARVPGYIYPMEDAMSSLLFYAERILSGGKADPGSDEGVWFIRNMYGMDWERFGWNYSPEQWDTLCEIIRPSAVCDGAMQLYLDRYLMLGCSGAPEAYRHGLGVLLNEQCTHEPNVFETAFETLSPAEREAVAAIAEAYGIEAHAVHTGGKDFIKKLVDGVTYYFDLDGDGLEDTVKYFVTDRGAWADRFAVEITRGAEPGSAYRYDSSYTGWTFVVDSTPNDGRLEIIIVDEKPSGPESTILRVNAPGTDYEVFKTGEARIGIDWLDIPAYMTGFSSENGFWVRRESYVLGRIWPSVNIRIGSSGIEQLGDYIFDPPFGPLYTLKRELPVTLLNADGSPGEAYSVPARQTFSLLSIDDVDADTVHFVIRLEDGRQAMLTVESDGNGGYTIDGINQFEYADFISEG